MRGVEGQGQAPHYTLVNPTALKVAIAVSVIILVLAPILYFGADTGGVAVFATLTAVGGIGFIALLALACNNVRQVAAPKKVEKEEEPEILSPVFSERTPPLPKTYPIQTQNIKTCLANLQFPDHLQKYQSKIKGAVEKALEKVQHLTFNQLQSKLSDCIAQLNPLIANKSYAIGVRTGASEEWVAELAKDQLTTQPKRRFDVEKTIRVDNQYTGWVDLNHVKEGTLVIFDDCAYRGETMMYELNSINGYYKHMNKKDINVIVVIPFASERAANFLRSCQYSNIKVTFITSDIKIASITDSLSEEETQWIKNAFDHEVRGHRVLGLPILTLCYTDWNGQSSSNPRRFGETVIPKVPRIYGK